MGYEYSTQVRMVPLNGPEETVDLMAALTDAGGPVRHRVRYDFEKEDRETINRTMRNLKLGFRVVVDLYMDITTMADHATVAQIVNRLASDDWEVYLSLDGGTTERVVDLEDAPSPEPFGHKTFAGARFVARVVTRSLISEMPAIGSGSW